MEPKKNKQESKRKLSIKKETIQEMDKYFDVSATNIHAGLCIDIKTIDIPTPNDTSCNSCVGCGGCGGCSCAAYEGFE